MDNNHNNFIKAKKFCIRLISVRQRSEKEIFDRLKMKGFDLSVIKSVVSTFNAEGLIDDRKFTREWIDARLRTNPRSKTLLELELQTKGIDENIIEEAFCEREKELSDRTIAVRLIENKIPAGKKLVELKEKSRIYRFLVSKGIDGEIAQELINEISDHEQ